MTTVISYLIGIIMFVLQVHILKHTYYVEIKGTWYREYLDEPKLQPIKVPLYLVIFMALCTLLPYVWVGCSLVFWIIWLKRYSDPEDLNIHKVNTYWRLRDNFLMKPI